MTNIVPVNLGARSYEVRIGPGLLTDISAQISPLLRRKRVAIVTDANVAEKHLPMLLSHAGGYDGGGKNRRGHGFGAGFICALP